MITWTTATKRTFNICSSWRLGPATAVSEPVPMDALLGQRICSKVSRGQQHPNAGVILDFTAMMNRPIDFSAWRMDAQQQASLDRQKAHSFTCLHHFHSNRYFCIFVAKLGHSFAYRRKERVEQLRLRGRGNFSLVGRAGKARHQGHPHLVERTGPQSRSKFRTWFWSRGEAIKVPRTCGVSGTSMSVCPSVWGPTPGSTP